MLTYYYYFCKFTYNNLNSCLDQIQHRYILVEGTTIVNTRHQCWNSGSGFNNKSDEWCRC